MKLIRGFEITPAGQNAFDVAYLRFHDENAKWSYIMSEVEYSLEQQMEKGDKERESWSQIEVIIRGVEMTEEQWEELEDDS